MRIVITALHYHPDQPGGAQRLALEHASFLAELGHEVWLVSQDLGRTREEHTFRDKIHVLRYPSPKFGGFDFRRITAHQKQTRMLLRRYVGREVDLVHGHSLLNYAGTLALYGSGTRRCYTVHSPTYLEILARDRQVPRLERLRLFATAWLTHRIECRCLENSHVITVLSNYTADLLRNLHGPVFEAKTRVIPGWVDSARFQIIQDYNKARSELGWPLEIPVLFTLRRLVPRMGLDRFLCALKQVELTGRRFHAIIGGDGPLRADLEMRAAKLGLVDKVRFIGLVRDVDLPKMYAAADAFVLPTRELECFGLIALEALACGRPVLATPVGAIPEVINNFDPRWLARDESSEAIAEILIDFLNGKIPGRTPESLRQTVMGRYSGEKVLAQLFAASLGDARDR